MAACEIRGKERKGVREETRRDDTRNETHRRRLRIRIERDFVVLVVEGSRALSHRHRAAQTTKHGVRDRQSRGPRSLFLRCLSAKLPPRDDVCLVEVGNVQLERVFLIVDLGSLERLGHLSESEEVDGNRRGFDILVADEGGTEVPHPVSEGNDVVVGKGDAEDLGEGSGWKGRKRKRNKASLGFARLLRLAFLQRDPQSLRTDLMIFQSSLDAPGGGTAVLPS